MADIKLVIKMAQETYNNLKIGCTQRVSNGEMIEALKNGIPLPKGHERLIDADALKKYINDCDCCVGCEDESYGCADKCRCPDYLDEGMERIINNQPTIIEADKAESEDKE